jgi:TM2 domain-containing membrane protein YozV
MNTNFCSNCGEKLDANLSIKECPKCHSALHEHSDHIQSPPRVVEQMPYKSPGTAALIAFIGGIFGLPGIGHMYVGKVGKGIAILVTGIVLAILAFITFWAIITVVIFGIAYLVLFIWQIFDARKLGKKFNESVKTIGKEPW